MPAIPCLRLLGLADRHDRRVLPAENTGGLPIQQGVISPGARAFDKASRCPGPGLKYPVEIIGDASQSPCPRPRARSATSSTPDRHSLFERGSHQSIRTFDSADVPLPPVSEASRRAAEATPSRVIAELPQRVF
jgi:hypothetical protein